MEKRHRDMRKIADIMSLIIWEDPLPTHCRPHILSGDWAGYWECHIENDWLLIYDLNLIEQAVSFSRTGTHSDLF